MPATRALLDISSEQPLEIFHLSKEEKKIRSHVMVIFLDGIALPRPFGQLKYRLWGRAANTNELKGPA